MDEMESKLNSILGNPQMMQQIMAMAQAMGQQDAPRQEEKPPEPPVQKQQTADMPNMPDAAMLQKIAGLARQSGVDRNQQALLRALTPYLSRERIAKLERAMRAAKIAAVASTALGGNLPFIFGR